LLESKEKNSKKHPKHEKTNVTMPTPPVGSAAEGCSLGWRRGWAPPPLFKLQGFLKQTQKPY